MRRLPLVLAIVAVGCADPAPEASTPPDAVVQAPTTLGPAPGDSASGPPAPVAEDVPSAPTPDSAPDPVQEPAPASGPPAPPRPEASDAPLTPPPSPRRTEAAEAFWTSFRAAIRSGDRATLAAGLADIVTVGEVEYRRDSPQVQSVLEQIVENEQVRNAYVDADRLVHGPEESAFSSVARVETPEGDVTRARISGAVREVAPGDWRLVRLRTDPVEA